MMIQSELPGDREPLRKGDRLEYRESVEHNCPNGNGGAQRSPQHGWKPCGECKGIRGLDCEAYKPIRDESRA